MRKLVLFSLLLTSITLSAQTLDLPQKSPKASVSYTVGLTAINIEYSSPAVNDRTLWGKVVPYDEIWRAGANKATTVEFSTDVNVEGTVIEKGKYAFFVIPKAGPDSKWTVIFNKQHDQWGAYRYDASQDAARIEVKPQFKKVTEERLSFSIHDQAVDKGYIKMAWGDLRLYLRFKVEVLEQALANVDDAIESAPADQKWQVYAYGAMFLLDNGWETRQAMEWADKSVTLSENSWNTYLKARAQAESGDYSGAIQSANKCRMLGNTNPDDNFYANNKDEVEGSLSEWKAKM